MIINSLIHYCAHQQIKAIAAKYQAEHDQQQQAFFSGNTSSPAIQVSRYLKLKPQDPSRYFSGNPLLPDTQRPVSFPKEAHGCVAFKSTSVLTSVSQFWIRKPCGLLSVWVSSTLICPLVTSLRSTVLLERISCWVA